MIFNYKLSYKYFKIVDYLQTLNPTYKYILSITTPLVIG